MNVEIRSGGRQGPARRLARHLVPALLVALLASSALATGAGAAPSKFVLEYCDPELPQTSDPWLTFSVTPPEGVPVRWFNDCLKPGGSIGIQEVGNSGDAEATLSVSVPATPGGFVESESILGGTAALGPANTGVYIREPGWPFPNGGEGLKVFRVHASPPPSGEGDGDFTIGWNCVGPLNSCAAGPIVYARDIAATEVDPVPPRISAGGPLLSGQPARGTEGLEGDASDIGGGVAQVSVFVNGLPAAAPLTPPCALATAAAESYEGTVAVDPTPCPARAEADWSLATTVAPFHEGANEVVVCAQDFSVLTPGQRSCTTPTWVLVDNSCTESPQAGGEGLSVAFAGRQGEALAVGFGQPAMVSGELTSASGAPVGGATICLQAQTEGSGQSLRTFGTATTDGEGHFDFEVPPGPNRLLLIGYRHDSFQVTHELRLRSHVRASLSASARKLRNGRRIHFSGRLPGPRSAGRVVILQANVKGSRRWITFRKATSDGQGTFGAAYHFTATTRPTTYRFRAVVPRQAGYPWAQGDSSPVVVRVLPARRAGS